MGEGDGRRNVAPIRRGSKMTRLVIIRSGRQV